MSASELHAAVSRLVTAGLIDQEKRRPKRKAALEYLLSGVPYAFPAIRGPLNRGMPTSFAAPVLADQLAASDDAKPVWPDAEGTILGYSIEPLHPSAPKAARQSREFYDVLALIDALREGRVRERQLAEDGLIRRMKHS